MNRLLAFAARFRIRVPLLLMALVVLISCSHQGCPPEGKGTRVNYKGKLYWWEDDTDGGRQIIYQERPDSPIWDPVYDKKLADTITAIAQQQLAGDPYLGFLSGPPGVRAASTTGPGSTIIYLLDRTGVLLKVDPGLNQVTAKLDFSRAIGTALPQRFDITPDASLAFITVSGPQAASVLVASLTSFSIVSTITLPATTIVGGIAITPDAKLAYVVTQPFSGSGPSNVYVIDTATRQIVTTIPVSESSNLGQIAMTLDGTEAYLIDSVDTSEFFISVIDITTNTVEPNIRIFPSSAPGYMALHPDGTRLYLTPIDGGPIKIVSTITKTVVGTIPLATGTQPAFASDPTFTPDGRFLFVMNGPAMIAVIDTLSDTVESTINVPAPRIASTRHAGFVFVKDP